MKPSPRPTPSTPRDFQFPTFERTTLPNGLKLIVAPMRRLPVVTAILVVDGGATVERAGKEGVADLTTRVLTEGTRTKSADDLVMALERLGTSISASADWESSILKMTVMSPNLRRAVSLLAELAMTPRLEESAVNRLRAERLSEIVQMRSEPSVLADETLAAGLYGGAARYGIPLAGTEHSVSTIMAADVRAYHASVFTPQSTTLVLAGDIDATEAHNFAAESFGGWEVARNAIETGRSAIGNEKRDRVTVVDRIGAQQSELRMGHVGVPRSVPQYFDVVVMNAVLGGLFSSRINLNLREAHGYTYGASSYFDWRRDAGPFVISTAVQSEVTGAAIKEVLNEIDRIQSQRIDESELTLATSYLAGVFPIRYETADAVASGLASLTIFDLPNDYFTSYRSKILAVTAEKVQQAAQAFLRTDDLTIVVAGNPAIVAPQLEALELSGVRISGATG